MSPSTVYVLPEARADLAGEDASLAHADVNREREARVDDGAHRSEHPLLVVAEGLRCARHEDDATAVAIDVAFEEGHLVLVRGRLHGAHESVERVRSRLGSLGLDDLVRAGEADEGDRGVSVLSLERPDLEQLCAQRRWDRDLERDALDGGERLDRAADLRCCAKQATVALLLAERVLAERRPRSPRSRGSRRPPMSPPSRRSGSLQGR